MDTVAVKNHQGLNQIGNIAIAGSSQAATSEKQSVLYYLLRKDVTRTEFLSLMAIAVVSLFGFSSIIHVVTGTHPTHKLINSVTPGNKSYGSKSL